MRWLLYSLPRWCCLYPRAALLLPLSLPLGCLLSLQLSLSSIPIANRQFTATSPLTSEVYLCIFFPFFPVKLLDPLCQLPRHANIPIRIVAGKLAHVNMIFRDRKGSDCDRLRTSRSSLLIRLCGQGDRNRHDWLIYGEKVANYIHVEFGNSVHRIA